MIDSFSSIADICRKDCLNNLKGKSNNLIINSNWRYKW